MHLTISNQKVYKMLILQNKYNTLLSHDFFYTLDTVHYLDFDLCLLR